MNLKDIIDNADEIEEKCDEKETERERANTKYGEMLNDE